MNGFLLGMAATAIAGLGARDQLLVRALTARQGRRGAVLLSALASAAITALLTAWAAEAVAGRVASDGRQVLCLCALVLAGAELLLSPAVRAPAEPTDSLGALTLVLLAQQLTGAGRLLLFALALVAADPVPIGLGGAIGAGLAVAAGWVGGEELAGRRLRFLRRALGGVLLALVLGSLAIA